METAQNSKIENPKDSSPPNDLSGQQPANKRQSPGLQVNQGPPADIPLDAHTTTADQPEEPVTQASTLNQGHPAQQERNTFNVFLFRRDLKNIDKSEWEEVSATLLLAQVRQGLLLDLSKSRPNRFRRSHQISCKSEDDGRLVTELIKSTLDPTYCVFCPNLTEEIAMGAQRVITYLPKKLLPCLDAGLLTNLLQIGVPDINPVSNHLQLPVPPKILDDGRIAIVYQISPELLSYLKLNNFRIPLIGVELRFKLISSLRGTAEIALNLGRINFEQ